MSSFIAHSLTALSIHSWKQLSVSRYLKISWLVWLIVIASAPDIDHIVRSFHLKSSSYQDIRITHSILLSLVLPLVTVLLVFIFGSKEYRKLLSLQALLAGISHLVLDLLTGVNTLPLLYPFSLEIFKLPFGVLPSAGRINLFNYFLYRNLVIEMGVLAPLFYASLIRHNFNKTPLEKLKLGGLLLISSCFMFWAFSLKR